MERVSSNLTLILRLFIPTFWIAFFGALTAAVWLTDARNFGGIPGHVLRIGVTVFFLSGIVFFWLTFFRLRRVEMAPDFIYVSDYFKHVRFPYHNVDKIEELDYLLFNLVRIHLKVPGYFGKKVVFIPSKVRFQDFLNTHPEVVRHLLPKAGKD